MKKFLSVLLVMVLVLSLCCTSALACGARGQSSKAAKAAANIIKTAEAIALQAKVDATNAAIKAMVVTAQLTIWDDVNWLIAGTEALIAEANSYAARLGATLGCEYTNYFVDGRWVAIDPIHVINWP